MNNFFKENKKLFICFLVISTIIPIIILTPSPIGFIEYETGLTLVGYCGSIIGGFLTLYDVWWTISDAEKIRQSTNVELHKPFLKISSVPAEKQFSKVIPKLFKMYISFLTKTNEDTFVYLNKNTFIKLENVGNGIAKNISFKFDKIKSSENSDICYDLSIDTLYDFPYIQKRLRNYTYTFKNKF